MDVQLVIPDSISQAMRLPRSKQYQRLMEELAVTLYAQGILSFGKARELIEVSKYEFGIILGKRQIPRHYTNEDFKDDIAYAYRE